MNNKRKGKKKPNTMNYKKGFRSEDRDIQDDRNFSDKFRSANDPAWYTKYQDLASWARTIDFNRPAGSPIADRYEASTPTSLPDSIAGIMTFDVNPSIGIATSANDAVNTNAVKYFNTIRGIVSGSRTYEAPDLMLYTIAAANLYSAYNWAARLYGMAFNFSQQNRYIGDAFLKASGVDPVDFRRNLADFRLFLNSYASKISVFAVPSKMTYFNRVNFLYSGIYADSNTSKAQIYMNVPHHFLQYDSTGSPHGGQLLAKIPPTTIWNGDPQAASVAAIEAYLNTLLDAMFYDQDMYTMSGDIHKAFSGDLLVANPIAEQFNVPVLYDEAVLSQFNNATLFNHGMNDGTPIVKQDQNNGILLCTLSDGAAFKGRDINAVLNFHKQDISIDDIFEAVPFVVSFKERISGSTVFADVVSMGTEFLSRAHAFYFASNGVLNRVDLRRENYVDVNALDATALETHMRSASVVSQFDWAPEIFVDSYDSSQTTPYDIKIVGDLYDYDVYSVLDDRQVGRLHDIALWSLFAIE